MLKRLRRWFGEYYTYRDLSDRIDGLDRRIGLLEKRKSEYIADQLAIFYTYIDELEKKIDTK